MNIHQVNVSYAGEQDRLLLRINSQSGEEFRIWLTRRMTLQLLPVLDKSSQTQLQAQMPALDPAAPLPQQRQQLVHNFQKEAAAYQGDFQTPFKDQPAALPLGEEPLLVTELGLTPLPDGKLQMAMMERLAQRKRDMQLVMDTTLTQGLLRLLHQALKASDWLQVPNLQELPAGAAAVLGNEEPETTPTKDKPRYLN
jgi:hypothetical protein